MASVFVFTVLIALASTAAVLPIGTAVAWILSRSREPVRSTLEVIVSLPLVLPPTAVGLFLLELLKPHGLVGRVLERLGIDILFTWKAVVIASAVISSPLLIRPARVAFESVDPRLPKLARTLGCSPARAFFRVSLPLAWPGIRGGALLAFARALGEFGATVLIAGNIPGRTQTLALAIFDRIQAGDDAQALRAAGLSLCLAAAAVWVTERLQRRPA